MAEPPAIQRHAIQVPRGARFHQLGEPDDACREVWFVLHGYGQLAGAFLESFRALASPARCLVAPEALSRFYLRRGTGEVGASWMTREEREGEIADTVRYLDLVAARVLGERATPVALQALGFSQGAAAAARWAVLGQTPIERVTLWGAGFPQDIDLARHVARARSTRWTFVLGERDDSVDRGALERDVARLRDAGGSTELLTFPGGHEVHGATLERLGRPPATGSG